jgi:hypothetical protein
MEGFSVVTPITGLNRLNTVKEDDDDDYDYDDVFMNAYYISQSINDLSVSKLRCVKVYGGRLQYLAWTGKRIGCVSYIIGLYVNYNSDGLAVYKCSVFCNQGNSMQFLLI